LAACAPERDALRCSAGRAQGALTCAAVCIAAAGGVARGRRGGGAATTPTGFSSAQKMGWYPVATVAFLAPRRARRAALMAASMSASAFAGNVAPLKAPVGGAASGRVAFAVVAKESRIGKASVKVPKGVTVTVKAEDNSVTAKARGAADIGGRKKAASDVALRGFRAAPKRARWR
jgi:hypothetical protein